ncbi:hypothetical protein LCL95_12890 [Bacillus timonensis]|nr:hypothetical protein [Bacillus timonensis]
MLVDINLLPKKETKNKTTYLVGIIILVLLIGCSAVIYSKYSAVKTTEYKLSKQLNTLKEIRGVEEKKYTASEGANSVIQLEKTVLWAEEYFVETVPLIRHLSSLLPERGYIQSFTYVDDGIVTLIVQFDTNKEVAHYLSSISNSSYLSSVKLNTVLTLPFNEEEEATNGSQNSLETFLPRYLAQYEIVLNKEELKVLQKEGN